MPSELVLGLDAGTTTVKAVVVDPDGAVVAEAASSPIATRHPEPGAAEQDPADLWRAIGEASRLAMSRAGDDQRVRALALAAQSGSVVPLDATGQAGPVVTWMDTRSEPVVRSWDPETRDRIRATSGWTPSPGLGLSTLAWLRSRRVDPAARYASVDDYLVHRLTGDWVTNPSNAAGMQLLDVARLEWDEYLCELAGTNVDRLSAIRPSGARLGSLDATAAEAMALTAGSQVMVGGHDQACAALALDVVDTGRLMVSAGTAWVLTTTVDHGDVSRLPAALNLGAHVVPGRWLASTSLGGVGALLEWWQHECGATRDELDADLVPGVQPTDPHFVPKLHDTARTAWGHFAAGEADETRPARTRAVVEAVAFELRRALSDVGPGPRPDGLTFVGGAAANRALVQLLADVTGVSVVALPGSSWPARGAAMLAAGGRRAGATPPAGERVVPDAGVTARHMPRYDVYRRLAGGRP